MMVKGRVHHFMSQRSGQCGGSERIDKFGIVVERDAVRGHGFDGSTFLSPQAEQERSEERVIEHQAGTSLLDAQGCGCTTTTTTTATTTGFHATGAPMYADMRLKM